MVFDIRLKENFKLFLAGPSACGKTTFIIDVIKHLDKITIQKPSKIIYFYTEWQPKFNYMKDELNTVFIEDNDMIIEEVKNLNESAFIIFDDMLNSSNLKAVAQLYSVHGRHLNLSLAFLSQKLFYNNEYFRQISQNSDYMCIFKNPRNSVEIRNLAMQITPKSLDLLHIYNKATKKPYSYIFINLTQECIPQLRYLNNIFNQDHVVNVYVLSDCRIF